MLWEVQLPAVSEEQLLDLRRWADAANGAAPDPGSGGAHAADPVASAAAGSPAHPSPSVTSASKDSPPLQDNLPSWIGVTGWEQRRVKVKVPGQQGKFRYQYRAAPTVTDLGKALDPEAAAEQGARLNLELMRWRQMPGLDTRKVARTRFLLLGAGTLGCFVARSLVAWGARRLTFLDSGTVSASNPVRQPLFEAKDAAEGGRPKARAAAEAIRRVLPAVEAAAIRLRIPMPGHSAGPKGGRGQREALGAHGELLRAVRNHDVVFVLTDTRESRWLPTLMCAALGKPCLNVALGFDSCVVIRSGCRGPGELVEVGGVTSGSGGVASDGASAPGRPAGKPLPSSSPPTSSSPSSPRLGCYFCQDVVAPADSTQGRTLDQQCTVTRPGLAPIASALAAELAVGLLHHPAGFRAPHDEGGGGGVGAIRSEFGAMPHCARFFLRRWQPVLGGSPAFPECTACGDKVCEAYGKDPESFLLSAMEDDRGGRSGSGTGSEEQGGSAGEEIGRKGDRGRPGGGGGGFLEEVSGLADMKRRMDGAAAGAAAGTATPSGGVAKAGGEATAARSSKARGDLAEAAPVGGDKGADDEWELL